MPNRFTIFKINVGEKYDKMTMKKLLLLLILFSAFKSCENLSENQKSTEIHKSEQKKNTEINRNIDSLQNVAQYADSEDLLFDIAGNYTLPEDKVTDCKFFLSLFFKNGTLKYDIQINTKKHSGNAEIVLNERADGYYITFKDIEWSEYLGAIDPEGTNSEEDLELPRNIQGVLYKDEITIQNSGNAMNYYVKFGECDVMYIHLIK